MISKEASVFTFVVGVGVGLIVGGAAAWFFFSLMNVSQDCDCHLKDHIGE